MTDYGAAHLNLLFDNSYRTPWLASNILSKYPLLARYAAKALLLLLSKTTPGNRTGFEQYIIDTEDLYASLCSFANSDVALCVWQHGRIWKVLFMFLAPRFLLAPDHVLDAERIHARWQCMLANKRAMQLP